MERSIETVLLRRIRIWILLFMVGLVVSGATAIPLQGELDLLVKWTRAGQFASGPNSGHDSAFVTWLLKVHSALNETSRNSSFLYYGTDWLAFGHFVIAIAFVGALRDPVRNAWLFDFGIIACVLVVPYALVFGAVRGIPIWWRLIDCSFGLVGLVPLYLCRRWARLLEEMAGHRDRSPGHFKGC